MTWFTTTPSTIRTISLIRIVTTHFKCDQRNFIISQMEYARARVVIRFFRLNGTMVIPVLVPYCFTMHKVIVIRHSDDNNQNSKYVANLQKNKDGSYSASVGVVKEDGYNDYVSKHGLHFTKALQEYASKQMVNSNNQEHTWTSEQVQNVCNVLNLKIPDTSTIEDVTYTANMAYADFYPELLNEHQCIKYAVAVANDKDGYTGIQFCRWMADVVGKKENIDWDKFK